MVLCLHTQVCSGGESKVGSHLKEPTLTLCLSHGGRPSHEKAFPTRLRMKRKRRAFENAGHAKTPIMQKADAPVESVGFRALHPSVSRQARGDMGLRTLSIV